MDNDFDKLESDNSDYIDQPEDDNRNSSDEITQVVETPTIVPTENPTPNVSAYPIFVNFDKTAIHIEFVVAATKQKEKMVAANGELRMLTGRLYMVPIKSPYPSINIKQIDSDQFANMKIFSDMSDLIDVRFVKDGVACVMPLQHGIILKHDQRLCVLW